MKLEAGLALLSHPDREVRRVAAEAVTAGLAPGLRTRAFIFNTLLLDKSTDDRLRSYPTWISSRNLANEASDESVQALVDAVIGRYDLPQRWYRLKADILGRRPAGRLRPHGIGGQRRGALSAGRRPRTSCWSATTRFSPELAGVVRRFFDEPLDRRARCDRASDPVPSAPTRCRATTPTCC